MKRTTEERLQTLMRALPHASTPRELQFYNAALEWERACYEADGMPMQLLESSSEYTELSINAPEQLKLWRAAEVILEETSPYQYVFRGRAKGPRNELRLTMHITTAQFKDYWIAAEALHSLLRDAAKNLAGDLSKRLPK